MSCDGTQGKFDRKVKKTILTSLITVFFLIWIVGFGSSIFASKCLSDNTSPRSKLTSCNIASATTLSRFVSSDETEFVAIELERGISLIENQRMKDGTYAIRKILEKYGLAGRDGRNAETRSLNPVEVVIFRRVKLLDPSSDAFSVFAHEMR